MSFKLIGDLFWPEKCSECGRRKVRFTFPLLGYHGISLCRPCYNKVVAKKEFRDWRDYYVSFHPIRDLIGKIKYWREKA